MTITNISKFADDLIASVSSNKKKVAEEKKKVEGKKTEKMAGHKKVEIKYAQDLKKLANEIRNANFSNDITYQDVQNYVKLLTK